MIEKVVGFKVGEQFFPTIEEAQKQELIQVLSLDGDTLTVESEAIVIHILKNKDKVLDILTMTPSSRPKARKANGGKKTRKASPEAVNAALQDGKQ